MTDYSGKEAVECIITAEACIIRILNRLKAKAYDRETESLRHLIKRDEEALLFLKSLKELYLNCEELATEPETETEEFSRRINGGRK